MGQIIAKLIWFIILVVVSSFSSCGTYEPPKEHITKGRYLVNTINSDQNRYADETYYFYKGFR